MLKIIGYDLTAIDKDNVEKIFSHTSLDKSRFTIIDLKWTDVDAETAGAMFVVGKTAIRLLVRELVKSGFIGNSVFVGNDMVNKESGFMFVNVGLEVSEIMTSQENKDFMWEKVSSAAQLYLEMFPEEAMVFDEVPDLSVATEVIPVTAVVEQTVSEPPIVVGADVTYQVGEILDKLYEHVSLSDPSLGKTLSKYEKFVLHTTSGELAVYPTTRIPEDEERDSITFKDLVLLLKYFTIMNAEHVTLKRKDGHTNS